MPALLKSLSRIGASHQDEDVFTIRSVDPLIKVFRKGAVLESEALADVAKGEYASFQFVLKSPRQIKNLKVSYEPAVFNKYNLTAAKIGYVGYVKLEALAGRKAADDQLVSEDKLYPDPVFDTAPSVVSNQTNQAVKVEIPVALNKPSGLYTGKVIFEGTNGSVKFRKEKIIRVKVYPVSIMNNTLLSSNWEFHENEACPPCAKLRYMNEGKEVIPNSPRYWELLEIIAKNMRNYRQNVFYVSPLRETKYSFYKGKYVFDFRNFDRLVSLFKQYGAAEYIEGGHLGGRASGWDSPFTLSYMLPGGNGGAQLINTGIRDARSRAFYQQFIPALVAHLKLKGWYSRYYQHLIDEPADRNAEEYIILSRFFKQLAPDLKIIDAVQTNKIAGHIDIWVPVLDYLSDHYDFFQEQQKSGEQVWLYTCWLPQGNFANRFIELPAIKNRLLPWISYKYGITGNLNWGYNYWVGNPLEKADRKDGESVYPGGDSWLVYPKLSGLTSSIRQEMMRDGTFDYELLYMLGKKNSSMARMLVDRVVYKFDNYNTDVKNFRQVRKLILYELSK